MPADWIDKLIAGGPALIFATLWWLERGERIDSQKELKQIARDQTIAATSMEKTIGQWASLFRSPGSNQ